MMVNLVEMTRGRGGDVEAESSAKAQTPMGPSILGAASVCGSRFGLGLAAKSVPQRLDELEPR